MTLPCRDEDLAFALEMEEALGLSEAAITGNLVLIGMNGLLKREDSLTKNLVSQAGREQGLALVRTISELVVWWHPQLASDTTDPPSQCSCGALCDSDCIASAEPILMTLEEEEAPAPASSQSQGPSHSPNIRGKFCWVCGGALLRPPHTRNLPCQVNGGQCIVCKREGHYAKAHYAKAHYATDEDAKAALVFKYGDTFRFLTKKNPRDTKRKQPLPRQASKKAKIMEIKSDSD